MWGAFPDLNWARLRVFTDGSADVFDMDGVTHEFSDVEESRMFLAEDEFSKLGSFDEEGEREWGMALRSITPPSGASDEELLPKMFVKAE